MPSRSLASCSICSGDPAAASRSSQFWQRISSTSRSRFSFSRSVSICRSCRWLLSRPTRAYTSSATPRIRTIVLEFRISPPRSPAGRHAYRFTIKHFLTFWKKFFAERADFSIIFLHEPISLQITFHRPSKKR